MNPIAWGSLVTAAWLAATAPFVPLDRLRWEAVPQLVLGVLAGNCLNAWLGRFATRRGPVTLLMFAGFGGALFAWTVDPPRFAHATGSLVLVEVATLVLHGGTLGAFLGMVAGGTGLLHRAELALLFGAVMLVNVSQRLAYTGSPAAEHALVILALATSPPRPR